MSPNHGNPNNVKTCAVCGLEKPINEFYRRKENRRAECRSCFKLRYHSSPEYRKRHVAQMAKYRAKGGNLKRNVARKVLWAIETGKLKRGNCEVCGSPNANAHHELQ